MEHLALVRQFLGSAVGKPETELDFVPMIRRGFPLSAFTSLRNRTRFNEKTIFGSLRIARRTAARRKGQARLKPAESERLLRLARVLAAATDILGDEEKARGWLLAENRALGGKAPISFLDTGIGFQGVMDVLSRIEHGVYS